MAKQSGSQMSLNLIGQVFVMPLSVLLHPWVWFTHKVIEDHAVHSLWPTYVPFFMNLHIMESNLKNLVMNHVQSDASVLRMCLELEQDLP